MGHQIAKWIADDGSEHNTERDMVMHEMEAVDAKEIEAFLRDEDGKPPKRWREYTRILTEWQKYVRANYFDAAVPAALPDSASTESAPIDGNPEASWKPKDYAFGTEGVGEDDPFAGATTI